MDQYRVVGEEKTHLIDPSNGFSYWRMFNWLYLHSSLYISISYFILQTDKEKKQEKEEEDGKEGGARGIPWRNPLEK
jgi:hypothetical protein